MRITKKHGLIAGASALAMAASVAFLTISGADAAVAGTQCSPRGAVTGSPTLICTTVPSSPTAYRWRRIVAAPGPKGPVGPAGAKGPAGPVGPAGTPGGPAGADGKDGAIGPAGAPGQDGKDGAVGPAGKDGKDGVTGLQADGPYPGATQVTGGNSKDTFKGDKGATLQTAWVRCDDGKFAVGGGFNVQGGADDNGDTRAKAIQVVGSFPFSLKKDGTFDDSLVQKNANQSLTPNAWVVKGFNNGEDDLTVRPWVVCAKVS